MSAQAMMSARAYDNITTEVKTKKHQWLSISRLFVYGYPAEGAGKRGDARGRHRRPRTPTGDGYSIVFQLGEEIMPLLWKGLNVMMV